MKPKEMVGATYKAAGRILEVRSSGEVCRDRTEIYNMKHYKGSLNHSLKQKVDYKRSE